MVVYIDKDKKPIITPIDTDKSISPGLQFTLEILLNDYPYEIPFHIEGLMLSENGRILATLSSFRLLQSQTTQSQIREIYSLKADDVARDFRKPKPEQVSLVAWLNKEILDEINALRQKHNGDAIFKIQLNILTFYFNITLHHTALVRAEQYGLPRMLSSEENIMVSTYFPSGFSTGKRNLWLLSGKDSPTFLQVYEYVYNITVDIPESEWIKKFAPKLGLGTYFIVEVPAKGVLKDAWSIVEEAEEAFNRCDINSVYAKCREVGYLLDNLIRQSNLSDFVKKEKWGRVYGRFEHIASLGLHIEELKKSQKYKPEDIKITQEDCRHLLTITKSLIKYAEDLGIR
jgi:hypothetical protein